MGWALLGLKFIPMLIHAITSTEKKSTKKGPEKQDEALELMRELLTLSQIKTSSTTDSEVVSRTEPETRALINAMVAYLNATRDASETPAKIQ